MFFLEEDYSEEEYKRLERLERDGDLFDEDEEVESENQLQ